MKHVREPLPDIQKLRPEISSALCAVIEKATAKETRNRYASAADMVADLERALGIEAARAGGTTNGQATSILSTLPPGTTDFSPRKRRRWGRWLLAAVVIAALATAGAIFGPDLFQGEGKQGKAAQPAPLRTAKVVGAKDFDPLGSGTGEHPEEVRNAFDRDPGTYWGTETYIDGTLPKDGVGLYVWASQSVPARRLELSTPTEDFSARVYGANTIPTDLDGWGKPLATLKGGQRKRASLPGRRFSHYLIWITKLPPQGQVQIGDVKLEY
jgi:eukaryotic-like serine/threonine-protein kinase